MKKFYSFFKTKIVFFILITTTFGLLLGCQKKETFNKDTVYLFWQDGCIHCHEALTYIQKKHPNMNIELLNIAQTPAREKLIQVAKEFKLPNQIGTPLFVMNKEILMGWSNTTREKFDLNAPKFQKK